MLSTETAHSSITVECTSKVYFPSKNSLWLPGRLDFRVEAGRLVEAVVHHPGERTHPQTDQLTVLGPRKQMAWAREPALFPSNSGEVLRETLPAQGAHLGTERLTRNWKDTWACLCHLSCFPTLGHSRLPEPA